MDRLTTDVEAIVRTDGVKVSLRVSVGQGAYDKSSVYEEDRVQDDYIGHRVRTAFACNTLRACADALVPTHEDIQRAILEANAAMTAVVRQGLSDPVTPES